MSAQTTDRPTAPPDTRDAAGSSHHPWAALCVAAVASVLAFLAIFAIWLNRQALNTDNWTTASTQMLDSPAVRARTADYLTDQLYNNVDVAGQIQSVLPPAVQALAAPAASFLRDQLDTRLRDALARPDVQALWADANRAAHVELLRALKGGGPVLSTDNGVVVLDLHALLAQTQARTGLGERLAKLIPPNAARLTILHSKQLRTAQTVARVLKPLAVVLVVLSLLLVALAMWLAKDERRRVLRAYGIGLVVAGAAALAVSALIGSHVVDSLTSVDSVKPAVRDVWTIYTSLFRQAATACIGYGIVIVGCAWLTGPTRAAVASRRAAAPYLANPALAFGALAVIAAIVVLWWQPTPATRNPVTAVVLVGLLALGLVALRRQTAREFSPAPPAAGPVAGPPVRPAAPGPPARAA